MRKLRPHLLPPLHGLVLGGLGGIVLGELGAPSLLSAPLSNLIIPATFVVGAIVGAMRRQTVLMLVDTALLAVYVLVAFTPMMRHVTPRFVRDDRPENVDAVVALSSGLLETGALDGGGTDRLLTAIAYAERGLAPRLITTRSLTEIAGHITPSDSAQGRLIAITRLTAPWTIVDSVWSTRDEAVRVSGAVRAAGERRVAVVTSPIHTRRACAAFEHEGLAVTCIAATEHAINAGAPATPPERLEAFRQCLYELLGGVKYRAKHWVS